MPTCSIVQCGARINPNQLHLTMHRFPKNEVLCHKWLEVIGTENIKPGLKVPRVCSLHFTESSFTKTFDVIRLRDDAVPSIHLVKLPLHQDKLKMALVDQTEIKFCRVCLAVDVKMYDMREFQLRKMFQNITGIPVPQACDESERVVHRVCWECAARLTAASALRDKALLTDTLLKDLVHRNKRNIERLRQHYSYLKSSLTVQTVSTSADIKCGDTRTELHSDETEKSEIYKRRTKRKSSEEEKGTVFDEEEEPWIEIPIKTEIESDPFAENDINIQIKDEVSVTFSEESNFDDSFAAFKNDHDYGIRITEEHINEKSEDIEMIDAPQRYGIDFIEDNAEQQPTINAINNVLDELSGNDTEITIGPNDSDIVIEDYVEENPMLDGIGNVCKSKEDAQNLGDLVSVKKAKKRTKRKVGVRLSDGEKHTIITLKEEGVPVREIAEKIGKACNTVRFWLRRYQETGEVKYKRPGGTPKAYTDQSKRHRDIVSIYTTNPKTLVRATAAKFGVSQRTVRNHIRVAGITLPPYR